MKKQEGIYGSIRMNKQKYIDEFLNLYNQGLNDSQIAEQLGISYTTPRSWRIKMGLPKVFKYEVKFDIDKFEELYDRGLNYSQIAKELGSSSSAIQNYASKNGYTSNYRKYEDVEFTEEELQIILGTMYGDGCLTKYSKNSNARLHFAHSLKQTNYCLWKYNILKRFCYEPRYEENLDKRTNKIYYSLRVYTRVHPVFTKLYSSFYKDGIKYLNIELLNLLNPMGLAIWFMDDGYKHSNSISIATNCFSIEELETLVKIMEANFNLHFTIIPSSNIIHLKAADLNLFYNLVKPYIHADCSYKLDWCSLNSVKQGKAEEAVPVLNPQEIEENAERLEVMPNDKDEAINSSTKAGHYSE